MKILVTGAAGLLGRAVVDHAEARGYEVTPLDRSALDVTDPEAVQAALAGAAADIVVHCAAYTAVDRAESEPVVARSVNRDGTRHVADAAAGAGARLVYVSTDYVFDGAATAPYPPSAPTGPLSVYGRTKLEGERAALGAGPETLVVRTSWLYGRDQGFVPAVLRRAAEGEPLRIVADQTGRPTWVEHLAEGILDLVGRGARGVWHLAGEGSATWADLAREAIRLAGLDREIEEIDSASFGADARRPSYSVLDLTATETLLGRKDGRLAIGARHVPGDDSRRVLADPAFRIEGNDVSRRDDIERIRAGLAAAAEAVRPFTPGDVAFERKEDRGDPVTEADQAADAVLREILPTPGEGWLSEESVDDPVRLDRDRVWVVDPIDGTREFIEGIPEWCISIGLLEGGVPVAGGILNPATDEWVLGSLETGVTYNGAVARVTEPSNGVAPTVLASRSEIRRGEWDRFQDEGRFAVRPCGSVAYKLALVAAGKADATWTLVPKSEWDVVAGTALVRAAGGVVTLADGTDPEFNQVKPLYPNYVAAGRAVSEAFLEDWSKA